MGKVLHSSSISISLSPLRRFIIISHHHFFGPSFPITSIPHEARRSITHRRNTALHTYSTHRGRRSATPTTKRQAGIASSGCGRGSLKRITDRWKQRLLGCARECCFEGRATCRNTVRKGVKATPAIHESLGGWEACALLPGAFISDLTTYTAPLTA
jgi:hypothetical protein